MRRPIVAIARCSDCGRWLDASDLKRVRDSEGKLLRLCSACISDMKLKIKEASNGKRNGK